MLRQPRGELRTWLLLVLALVPTWGVLAGASWLWSEHGKDIEQFEAAGVPADTTYELFMLLSKLERAEASLQVAALADATPAEFDEAANDRAAAAMALRAAPAALDPLVDQQNIDGDVMNDVDMGVESLTVMSSSIALATDLLDQQVIGEPVNPQLQALTSFGDDAVGGLVLPFSDSGNQSATFLYQALATTVQYHDQFDRDRALLLDHLTATEELDLSLLDPNSGLRDSLWKDATDSRTFLSALAAVDWISTPADTPFNVQDPLGAAASRVETSSPDRHALIAELHRTGRALEGDVAAAYDGFSRVRRVQLAGIVADRRLTAIVSSLMAVFGVALASLTIAEVRRRRRVEAAHAEAMRLLAEKAFRDPSTGVWNRRRLEEIVPEMITLAPAKDESVVLAYLDLDHFKAINDVWGHRTGDRILQTVAERLIGFDYGDVGFELSRIGGDEFVLFASAPTPPLAWLEGLGKALLDAVDNQMEVNGRQHEVNASVGIATSTADSTLDSLLLEADSSLIHAKQERGTAVVYDRNTSRTGELVHDLPIALSQGQIGAYLQPVVDIHTGVVSHVEALARWIRPDGESVSPVEFIPLVESYGLAEKLTITILQSVRDIVVGRHIPSSVRVWVNVSPRELDVANFAERFVSILYRLGLPPARIGIEITETAAVRDPKRLAVELRRLREVGVAIAIDDFGNGYSPLGYLRDLPVDILKLDRSLVANIDVDLGNQHLVIGVVGLAHQLGIAIVAEGVEKPEERRWLAEHGVTRAQGFLFGRPTTPELFSWSPNPAANQTTV